MSMLLHQERYLQQNTAANMPLCMPPASNHSPNQPQDLYQPHRSLAKLHVPKEDMLLLKFKKTRGEVEQSIERCVRSRANAAKATNFVLALTPPPPFRMSSPGSVRQSILRLCCQHSIDHEFPVISIFVVQHKNLCSGRYCARGRKRVETARLSKN